MQWDCEGTSYCAAVQSALGYFKRFQKRLNFQSLWYHVRPGIVFHGSPSLVVIRCNGDGIGPLITPALAQLNGSTAFAN